MKIDFYTHTHKKQRKQLFALATNAGDIDYKDSAAVTLLSKEFNDVLLELRNHKNHEETFVHPLLLRKIPGSARSLHQEHLEMEHELSDLAMNFEHLQSLSTNYPKCQEQGLECYRALNRFIASYFVHINEEEYTMQNLWEVATDTELKGMMIAFQTYDGIEKGKKWLTSNLPAMNIEERILMYQTTQLMAPESIYKTMCQLSVGILGANEWQKISKEINAKI